MTAPKRGALRWFGEDHQFAVWWREAWYTRDAKALPDDLVDRLNKAYAHIEAESPEEHPFPEDICET